jgi:hypothetical protein
MTMQNIQTRIEGTKLIITLDASVNLGPSASGKTQMVATTQGNKQISVGGRAIYLGLNAYTK